MSESLTIFICGRRPQKSVKKYKCVKCETNFKSSDDYKSHECKGKKCLFCSGTGKTRDVLLREKNCKWCLDKPKGK